MIAGRKTYLFAFIDDHSRALVGYRWGLSEDTVRLEAALRLALAARGAPRSCLLGNGSATVSSSCYGRAPASGSVSCTPSPDHYRAGKIERSLLRHQPNADRHRLQFLGRLAQQVAASRPPGVRPWRCRLRRLRRLVERNPRRIRRASQ